MSDVPLEIHAWRAEYLNKEEPFLDESKLATHDPFKLFDLWFKNVASINTATFEEINAVCLSTVGKNMRPSSRMVLLKSYTDEKFTFYTYSNSRKGQEMQENPIACMLFYWPKVNRQVRIEGEVIKVPNEEAVAYWNSRPLASRIGSKSSDQSKVVPSREFLLEKQKTLEELAEKDGPESITKPDLWCGFALKPDYFEFWQGQSNRLHDRIEFRKSDGTWNIQRLSP